jgi:hypothetical protein
MKELVKLLIAHKLNNRQIAQMLTTVGSEAHLSLGYVGNPMSVIEELVGVVREPEEKP